MFQGSLHTDYKHRCRTTAEVVVFVVVLVLEEDERVVVSVV